MAFCVHMHIGARSVVRADLNLRAQMAFLPQRLPAFTTTAAQTVPFVEHEEESQGLSQGLMGVRSALTKQQGFACLSESLSPLQ